MQLLWGVLQGVTLRIQRMGLRPLWLMIALTVAYQGRRARSCKKAALRVVAWCWREAWA
jgi:hypothetical protein